jgi:L-alanine-DL-glutamate epimerase-like enolase superfamily enzyme
MTTARPLSLQVAIERWPISGSFTISRGAKTEAVVVVVELSDGRHVGRGECVPYPRYDETPEGTLALIEGLRARLAAGLSREALQDALPAGAARNALDCALWDLEAKASGKSVATLAGVSAAKPLTTAYTISLGPPDAMAEASRAAAHRPLLKVKLGGDGDEARIVAVRKAAPASELIVDANEAWTDANCAALLAACIDAGVTLVEQPLPSGHDDVLASDAVKQLRGRIVVCADESVHTQSSLSTLRGRYDAINIKLDKTGGLTEGLAMAALAENLGFSLMVGCMVATSLSMAPAMILAQRAKVVDLDGPLLLARDREHGLRYDGSTVYPPTSALWG